MFSCSPPEDPAQVEGGGGGNCGTTPGDGINQEGEGLRITECTQISGKCCHPEVIRETSAFDETLSGGPQQTAGPLKGSRVAPEPTLVWF